jgi:hypothetical protein
MANPTDRRSCKSADPFDQRSHIGVSVLLAELDEVAFPVAELFAPSDDIRPVENVDVWAETPSVAAPGMPWPASGTMLRQMSPQLDRMAVR